MPTKRNEPLSYWMALARLGFEGDVYRLMERNEVNRTGLAAEMAVSGPRITKMLRGDNNYQLATMAKIARALGAVLEIRLADENSEAVRVVSFADAGFLDDRMSQDERIASSPEGAASLLRFPKLEGVGTTLGAEVVKDVPPPAPRLSGGMSGG